MDVTIAEGIHYGFLLPWATVNSFNYWRHPWLLGEDLAPIFKDYARLRSRLIPYIYSCAYEAHLTGMPMMRPMVLAFPEEQAGHGYKYQYMLGPSRGRERLRMSCICRPGSGTTTERAKVLRGTNDKL